MLKGSQRFTRLGFRAEPTISSIIGAVESSDAAPTAVGSSRSPGIAASGAGVEQKKLFPPLSSFPCRFRLPEPKAINPAWLGDLPTHRGSGSRGARLCVGPDR
jgi:hypothetical protein